MASGIFSLIGSEAPTLVVAGPTAQGLQLPGAWGLPLAQWRSFLPQTQQGAHCLAQLPAFLSSPLPSAPCHSPAGVGHGERTRRRVRGGLSEAGSVPTLGGGGPLGHVAICNGDNHKTYPDDRRVTCAWPCPRELASRAQQAAAWYLSGLGDWRGEGWWIGCL